MAITERRDHLLSEMYELRRDTGDWSAEQRFRWDSINRDYARLKNEERAYQLARKIEEQRSAALTGWFSQHMSGVQPTDHHRASARDVGIDLRSGELEFRLQPIPPRCADDIEQRAQSTSTDGAGGYAVPVGFIREVELALLKFGALRQAGAQIIRTMTGARTTWPTIDDTGNTGSLEGENDVLAETDVAFGQFVLDAYIVSSDIVRASASFLQDNDIDFAQRIGEILGERIARKESALFTTGTGTDQPNGIVTASTLGKTTALSNSFTVDEWVDFQHSLDPAYRDLPSVAFMMHDSIVPQVRKLRDANGHFIWGPGLRLGEPDRLLGKPIYVNQDMASALATTNIVALYGPFEKYKIREVADPVLSVMNERYIEYQQSGFVVTRRIDGDLDDAGGGAIRSLKMA